MVESTIIKGRSRRYLFAICGLNAFALYAFASLKAPSMAALLALATSWESNWTGLVSAALAFAIVSVLDGVLPSHMKEQLVFWRQHNPLPGSRVFTQYGKNDPRVDVRRIKEKYGRLPHQPGEQNRLWYSIYKTVRHDPAVLQIQSDYLFCRDYTAVSAIFLIVGSVSCLVIASVQRTAACSVLLLIQYLIVRLAARNYGIRLATTVLAVSAENEGA